MFAEGKIQQCFMDIRRIMGQLLETDGCGADPYSLFFTDIG